MRNKLIIFFILTLIFIYFYLKKDKFSTQTKSYDIVFSINVHEKIEFIKKQLKNIKNNVKCSYCVIFNCGNFIYKKLKQEKFDDNIFINPEIINKKRFHGSLFQGIYSNIVYALSNFTFKYFFILSSRTIFFKNIDLNDITTSFNNEKLCFESTWASISNKDDLPINDKFNWESIKKSKLFEYYFSRFKKSYKGTHEGLIITNDALKFIYDFFINNNNILIDIYKLNGPMEEFVIQTILRNDYKNKKSFVNVNFCGNFDNCGIPNNDSFYFTHKIKRN
jgi:hypothetical protein